jgi:hypothetical protein
LLLLLLLLLTQRGCTLALLLLLRRVLLLQPALIVVVERCPAAARLRLRLACRCGSVGSELNDLQVVLVHAINTVLCRKHWGVLPRLEGHISTRLGVCSSRSSSSSNNNDGTSGLLTLLEAAEDNL